MKKVRRFLLCVAVFFLCLLYSCRPAEAHSFPPVGTMSTPRLQPRSVPRATGLPPITVLQTPESRVHEHHLLQHAFFSTTVSGDACPRVELPPGFPHFGMRIWELCYTTPTVENSADHDTDTPALTRHRPIEVVYTWRLRSQDEPFPLEMVVAPEGDQAWTSAILVALPDHEEIAPYFNVQLRYGTGSQPRVWAAQPHDPPCAIDRYGQLQAWRISLGSEDYEEQMLVIANGCVDELSPNFGLEHGASFFPDGERCLPDLEACGPGRYHCQYEP